MLLFRNQINPFVDIVDMSNSYYAFGANSCNSWDTFQSVAANYKNKSLNVTYYVQPTSITCQSTCLKMYAKYLESHFGMSNEGAAKSIQDIWTEINTGAERPVQYRNHYTNMIWWLDKYFQPLKFYRKTTKKPDEATKLIIKSIDHGFPLIASTNHSRTSGHIIMIIGYKNYSLVQKNYDNVEFICHDPYGKFNNSLNSKLYGKKRFDGGMSLIGGGNTGPGEGIAYSSNSIRRMRENRYGYMNYRLLTAQL